MALVEYSITILYFIFTFFTLGFSLLHIFKVEIPGDLFERLMMRIGIGLCIFPLILLVLHTVGLPLHWFVVLVVSSAVFFAHQVNHWIIKGNRISMRDKTGFKIRKVYIFHFVVCVFALVLMVVYLKGAFGIPYLEDDDPWLHSAGAKYVSIFRTYWVDSDLKDHVGQDFSYYLFPYPPFYTSMMGILHQLNDSVSWTLKFFNVFLISLGIIFFYVFAARFLDSHKHAMVACGFLVVLPSFMSHFIWAQTLAIVCFFPAVWALNNIYEHDRFHLKWFVIAVLLMGSMFMIQPWASGIFGFFFGLYWIARVASERSVLKSKFVLLAIVLACLVSLAHWGPSTLIGVGGQKYDVLGSDVFYVDDSGIGLRYTLMDFIVAPKVSKMDQATGLGVFAFFLTVFAFICLVFRWKKMSKTVWYWTALLWFLFGIYNFAALYTDLFRLTPHRMWAFFSIPVAILASEGFLSVLSLLRKNKGAALVVGVVLVAGILFTSGYPKYVVQTS
ncbi:MAG: hypothetical protein KJ687_06690, partial [Proteobacteria bacterium]|nr:hypothetical protein [Pseudomonadota bacterium]